MITEINIKTFLIKLYLLLGTIWCITQLPNLLARSKNRWYMAIAIAIFRLVLWPIGVTKYIKTLTNGDKNE